MFGKYAFAALPEIGSKLLFTDVGAYAMSRFKLPTSYKILLFLMLTMSFPPSH